MKALFDTFMDLEKAFNTVSREMVWWTLRKLEVEEWFAKRVMTVYDNARTMVKTKHGRT